MKVLVFGTFDQLHPGHIFFLGEAEKRGALHVVIARDVNVERLKGRSPLQSQTERQAALKKMFPNAHVVIGDANDFLVPVREISPDVIILGYDQRLPPGVREADFPCPVEHVGSLEPSKYKSSVRRQSFHLPGGEGKGEGV